MVNCCSMSEEFITIAGSKMTGRQKNVFSVARFFLPSSTYKCLFSTLVPSKTKQARVFRPDTKKVGARLLSPRSAFSIRRTQNTAGRCRKKAIILPLTSDYEATQSIFHISLKKKNETKCSSFDDDANTTVCFDHHRWFWASFTVHSFIKLANKTWRRH